MSSPNTSSQLKFVPLPAPLDTSQGDTIPLTADESSSYPCRRCLRFAALGEKLLLLSYNPFRGSSPYTGPGPIYVHAAPCDGDDDMSEKPRESVFAEDGVPHQLRRGWRSVRAYDGMHMMREARVVEGEKLRAALEEMFEDEAVVYVHVHFAGAGCFAVRVERG